MILVPSPARRYHRARGSGEQLMSSMATQCIAFNGLSHSGTHITVTGSSLPTGERERESASLKS